MLFTAGGIWSVHGSTVQAANFFSESGFLFYERPLLESSRFVSFSLTFVRVLSDSTVSAEADADDVPIPSAKRIVIIAHEELPRDDSSSNSVVQQGQQNDSASLDSAALARLNDRTTSIISDAHNNHPMSEPQVLSKSLVVLETSVTQKTAGVKTADEILTTASDVSEDSVEIVSEDEIREEKKEQVLSAAADWVVGGGPIPISLIQGLSKVRNQDNGSYARGRIIVKFKSEGPNAVEGCVQTLIDAKVPLQNYVQSRSGSLDRLNRLSRVKRARPLFLRRENLRTSEAQVLQQIHQDSVQQRFIERTNRAQKMRGSRPRPELPDLSNIYVMEIDDQFDPALISELYARDPHVEYAQPDYLMRPSVFPATPPNDTYFNYQWALKNTGQDFTVFEGKVGIPGADINASMAWLENLGSNIVVAVNDSGVDYYHSDLVGQIWSNPGEISGNGIDDDGNGFIDDVMGWDFGNGDNDPIDYDGHGTHVAGIIAASGDNNNGIIGVAPEAKIMIVKGFADDGSGYSSDLAAGLIYAAENGADVINNSWGCTERCPSDSTVENAVRTAHGLGAVVVFAAGNNNDDVAYWSPNNMTEPIVVAASDNTDARGVFSNFGSTVDVTAPGVLILSTDVACGPDDYCLRDGTSMAAPHVSGVAALILSRFSGREYSNADIEGIIKKTAEDIGLVNHGTGRLNADLASDDPEPLFPEVEVDVDPQVETPAGASISFLFTASDVSGEILTLTSRLSQASEFDVTGVSLADNRSALFDGADLSTIGATFTDYRNNTGLFSWTPTEDQVGLDPAVVFIATDSWGLSSQEVVQFEVLPAAVCGDEVVDLDEQCDDGNTISGDGCDEFCVLENCGDGVVDPGEECDDGNTEPADGCSAVCRREICGNAILDPGEECDEGDTDSGDGCSEVCVLEFCGDGIVQPGLGEECDDWGADSGDGCSAVCRFEICGNGISDPGEECDDGNEDDDDGCSAMCMAEFCGDGIVHPGLNEECDDGGTVSGDGCSSACVVEFCGDGILQTGLGEECDDGNTLDGDGCSAECVITSVCGNKMCEADESCSTCWQDCGSCRGGSRLRHGL